MSARKFWPLDFDPEGEIYESVAWDLPGFKRNRESRPPATAHRTKKSRRA